MAAAVPDVQRIATADFFAFAIPNAKKAAERSSMFTYTFKLGCSAIKIAIGVEREPGLITTFVTPTRTNSSTKEATYAVSESF